ncbi:MAG TPA: DNA-formamidopyrimidine glycosylase [Hyphomicrobiales bacterium]|nr:DNA-formamidopyrimidine glycosylase [Hyphomicrobiales bacterium]
MPELPDVEYFKRVVEENGLNRTVKSATVKDARILGQFSAKAFTAHLKGRRLVSVDRRGKHLLVKLNSGGWLTLHFGMSGGLQFVRHLDDEPPFTRVRLDFIGGGSLAYTNKRMLGRVGIAADAANFIAGERLGPDALDPAFDFQAFQAAVEGTKRDVKSVLMDQQIIAGIGNIYSDEILFQARIAPARAIAELSPVELKELFLQVRNVLKTAIACGAGSEQFVERMPKGSLLPERKKGGRCPRCGAPLAIFKVGGRTAYCCPHCQS